MNKRKLGNSSLYVSEIGLGCMSLSPESADIARLIDMAIEGGINFFDTADLYNRGRNEEWLGKAVSNRRKEVIISTKVGNQWRADGSGWDWNPTGAYIMQAIDQSLKRLQTDYIDLYQLHGGTMEDNMPEIVDTFETLQKQGKIRFFGISSIRPAVIERYAKEEKISSVMMQYSLLDKSPEAGSLDLLHQHGISVLARGVLAKGLLAGKPAAAYKDLPEEDVLSIQQKTLQQHPGKSLEAAALNYVLQQPAVASAIVGIRTEEQLKSALAANQQRQEKP
ncbi:MAG: aldo/keto reductase [Chitinophagaceae bacterium]|nr:aldo/keto reductase [Chitinophagaceae bacterium]